MNRVLIVLLLGLILPDIVMAQSLSIDLGNGDIPGSTTSRILQLVSLITLLSLAPSILMMITSFTKTVIVLSFLRSAIGLQQTPPNTVVVSLALFLTFFIMAPTFEKSYNEGIKPVIEERLSEDKGFVKAAEPFREFMQFHVRSKDLVLFADIAKLEVKEETVMPWQILIPAFMISEIKRAFEMGFLLFLPFLIIDMLIASILMAMGMMMLPPVMISLPFKLVFFVLIDGWYLICGNLVKSYGGG